MVRKAAFDARTVAHAGGAWKKADGDVCAGDVIRFRETVWSDEYNLYKRWRQSTPKPAGKRTITALVLRDSYGRDKQQHTFTLIVMKCVGDSPLRKGEQILRKGRNVYRWGVERRRWKDETARQAQLAEKHARGSTARAERAQRRMAYDFDEEP